MESPWSLARRGLESLRREHGSPARVGAAVAVGVLVGCSPFLGLHLVLGLGLATLFKLNRLAVLLGTQISTPPLTPLLLLGNAQVGAWLLTGRGLALSLAQIRATPAKRLVAELFWDLLLGGAVVGGVLAAVLGCCAASLVRRRQMQKRETA